MYILAIDTTGPVGTVCICRIGTGTDLQSDSLCRNETGTNRQFQNDEDGQFPMKVTTKMMSHLKNLMPMISELMDEQKVDRSEIAAVAASCGPGSFTGIRIGVSTARALAQAWDVPCIQVPTLEVFRQKCGAAKQDFDGGSDGLDGSDVSGGSDGSSGSGGSDGSEAISDRKKEDVSDGSVAVIFNARRGQVYAACYSADGETVIEPGPYMLAEVLSRIETLRIKPEFYGDGVDAYFDADEFRNRVSSYKAAPKDSRYQTAAMAAKYAIRKWENGDTVEYGKLLPDYMRESEAEQRLKDGSLEKMRKEKMERFMRMAGEK